MKEISKKQSAKWQMVKLGDVAEILSGYAFKSSAFNIDGKGKPIIRIRDVTSGSTSTFYQGDYDPNYLIYENDILIGMDGNFNREKWRSKPALLNQRVCKITVIPHRLSQNYLYYFLPNALQALEDKASFVTVKHLSTKQIKEIKIPLPPLAEQERIAMLLETADQIKQNCQKAIEILDTLPQSIFHQMFGSKEWPKVLIQNIALNTQYGTSSKAAAEGSLPILRMGNLTYEGRLDLSDLKYITLSEQEIEKYTVNKGDILFNRTNSPSLVGKTVHYRKADKIAFAGYLIRLRLNDQAMPDYVSTFMNSPYIKAFLHGKCKTAIGMANINAQELLKIKIPLPPLSLQEEFAKKIEKIEVQRQFYQERLAQAEQLFFSLQQQAFSQK